MFYSYQHSTRSVSAALGNLIDKISMRQKTGIGVHRYTPLFCFQATFGKLLPELAEIFNNRSRFRKPYRPTLYRQYVCNTNLIA